MKKLINEPAGVVREMLEGLVALNPGMALLARENVVLQSGLPELDKRKVAVLSGGGSGHEPAHAGYVGQGMLTCAVAGDVFTSPSTDAVLAGIRAASGPAGALLIVKNYTGDRLNFGLAAELARAEGIPVEIVTIADDVALRETVPAEQRRGIAGTVLVHKLAGAAAEAGRPLDEVARVARAAAARLSSMGISLGSCTLPAVGRPGFTLGEAEIEVGLGIHGEQGVRRMPIAPAEQLVALILQTIAADGGIKRGDRVVLLVNGLGATPPMELSIVARSALGQLRESGVLVERAWAGTFLSALDMPGFSLSILQADDETLALIDAPCRASAWPGGGKINANPTIPLAEMEHKPAAQQRRTVAGARLHAAARAAATALIAAEAELTELDSIAGDGDLGASMKRGGEAILALDDSAFADAATGLLSMGNALRKAIAGSSGPFYATGLLRAARELAGLDEPTPEQFAEAFRAAVTAISELGGAQPGDRTMIDALRPAADSFAAALTAGLAPAEAWAKAAAAGMAGADATKFMRPRLGRASYLGDRAMGHKDGGAVAVGIWLQAVAAFAAS